MVKSRKFEIMIWWSGDMVGWLECVIFCFPNVEMVKYWNGETSIWYNGDMVNRNFPMVNCFFGGHISIDGEMVKWWRNSIIKWIVSLDLTVAWVISYVSVSLIFYQNDNDVNTDDYGEDNLCYLWCLMVYLLLCNATSQFSMMAKWCNDEIIPDGSVMMVRLFRRRDSILVLVWILSLEWMLSPRKIFLGDNCFEHISSSLDKTCGTYPVGRYREFFSPGKKLTTIDTLLGCKLFQELSSDKLVILYLKWYIFISVYAKVCVRYGLFLYIRLQYVPVFPPNMSQGKRPPCGKYHQRNQRTNWLVHHILPLLPRSRDRILLTHHTCYGILYFLIDMIRPVVD